MKTYPGAILRAFTSATKRSEAAKLRTLVGLQDVADQRLGKTIRDAAQGRLLFLEKTGSVPRNLVLLAVEIIGILPQYLALTE